MKGGSGPPRLGVCGKVRGAACRVAVRVGIHGIEGPHADLFFLSPFRLSDAVPSAAWFTLPLTCSDALMPVSTPLRFAPRWRLALLALLPLHGCTPNAAIAPTPAPAPAQPNGEVLEYGIYGMPPRDHSAGPNAPRIGASDFSAWGDLLERTQSVPAQLGSFMGFCYRITGLNNRTVASLEYRVEHPPIARADGTVSRGFDYPRAMDVERGQIDGCSGFAFESPRELVPGRWRFSYGYRGQELLSQEFDVVGPDQSARGGRP